ncbi:hypothetical protein BDY24DRAFT_376240 [Mrakia frigida]|uniref:uncharacterized protein n=1 Tax=Mrakia frigida TaxID=29902 RepID=UPI003FCBFCA3
MLIKKMRELGEWEEGLEKRLSIHYGRHFDYTTNATKEIVRPLPDYVSRILASLPYSDPNHPTDQMTGQLYPAGSGIPPHVNPRRDRPSSLVAFLRRVVQRPDLPSLSFLLFCCAGRYPLSFRTRHLGNLTRINSNHGSQTLWSSRSSSYADT